MMNADDIIKELNLVPLDQEGGMYRITYESDTPLNGRPSCSVIYYLLSSETFSHMHRLPTDEVYYFFLGDPVELLELMPDGTHRKVILGQDIQNGQSVQAVIKAGSWQGSHLLNGGEANKFALLGTSMSPAFAPEDYEHGDRETLCRQYPQMRELINQLTHSK